MARKGSNALLHKAKEAKSDEFYTQLKDIESELANYSNNLFKGKTVYCNCDNPRLSNFFRYFFINFKLLGLKRLIGSCYCPTKTNLFDCGESQHGSYYIYSGESFINNISQIEPIKLSGDGDFRSEECIQFLKESDIVVTNPPFSLFREFVSLLTRYNKEFLIIGNINAITYKEVFTLIQKNQAWLGVNLGRGISGFVVPDDYELYGTEVTIDNNNKRIISPNNCLWLTNLEYNGRKTDISLSKIYRGHEDLYPKFDNYDGINVNRTQDIPTDYCGYMGVPITFLHKYNPEQFEIIRFRKGDDGKDLRVNGKCPYFRIIIRNKRLKSKTINTSITKTVEIRDGLFAM